LQSIIIIIIIPAAAAGLSGTSMTGSWQKQQRILWELTQLECQQECCISWHNRFSAAMCTV